MLVWHPERSLLHIRGVSRFITGIGGMGMGAKHRSRWWVKFVSTIGANVQMRWSLVSVRLLIQPKWVTAASEDVRQSHSAKGLKQRANASLAAGIRAFNCCISIIKINNRLAYSSDSEPHRCPRSHHVADLLNSNQPQPGWDLFKPDPPRIKNSQLIWDWPLWIQLIPFPPVDLQPAIAEEKELLLGAEGVSAEAVQPHLR